MKKNLALLAAMMVMLTGCGTYMEAKENTRAGGGIDQAKAAARSDLVAAKTQNTMLQDDKIQRDRELERMGKRIQSTQAQLDKQSVALNDALRARKITQTRHDQFKRDLNGIQAEMANMDLQNKMDAGTPANPQAQSEKERKLAALEKRKADLEAAMAGLLKR
ncbi:MAG: hypothetical protein V4706_10840 [Pseudomonadota bacterium]